MDGNAARASTSSASAAPEASPEEGRGGASAESPLDGAGAAAAAAASQLVGQWPEASPAAASTGGVGPTRVSALGAAPPAGEAAEEVQGRLAAVCSAVEAHAASAEGWAAECAALRRRCESAEEGARAALALLAATQRVAAAIAAESLRGRTEGGADAAEGGVADHPAADLSPREHRSLNGSREPPGAEWSPAAAPHRAGICSSSFSHGARRASLVGGDPRARRPRGFVRGLGRGALLARGRREDAPGRGERRVHQPPPHPQDLDPRWIR